MVGVYYKFKGEYDRNLTYVYNIKKVLKNWDLLLQKVDNCDIISVLC